MENIETLLNTYSLYVLALGSFFLVLLALIALKTKVKTPESKKLLFLSIIISAIVPTLVMSFSTIYLNIISSSNGPVHWHSDIEIWKCGQEVNLRDPKGLSNKIGTSTLHEHNDKRIHLEGVVIKHEDASLGNFFKVIGGKLSPNSFIVPVNEGLVEANNGDTCSNSGAGEVQVFVYTTDKDNFYTQKKVNNPQDYIISPDSNVPAGDCVIVEFDANKAKTDKICRSYKVALKIGKLKGER